jgi:hypothetical protein
MLDAVCGHLDRRGIFGYEDFSYLGSPVRRRQGGKVNMGNACLDDFSKYYDKVVCISQESREVLCHASFLMKDLLSNQNTYTSTTYGRF